MAPGGSEKFNETDDLCVWPVPSDLCSVSLIHTDVYRDGRTCMYLHSRSCAPITSMDQSNCINEKESKTGNKKSVGSTPTRKKQKAKRKEKKQTLASLAFTGRRDCAATIECLLTGHAMRAYPAPENIFTAPVPGKGQRPKNKKMQKIRTKKETSASASAFCFSSHTRAGPR